MSVVNAIFSNFLVFLMSFFMTLVPYKGIALPVLQTKEDDCRLNLAMISDVHLEANGVFRQAFLKTALLRINNAKSDVDAIVVAGDLTNYGDEPALAEYYEIITEKTDIPVITAAGNHDIGHAGDRDVGTEDKYQCKANVIKYHQQYYKDGVETTYYSYEVNGYKFVVLADEVDGFTIDEDGNMVDETGGHWDGITMTVEQLEFLDKELAEGTKEGNPVFVICHWPICNTTGEEIVWPDSGIDQNEYDLQSIMEKYDNVFYISGHMHSGIKATVIQDMYGLSSAEQINGVTYLNLPTFGIINSFGYPWSGTGAQLEVYADKVIYRPVSYLTGHWFVNSEFTFDLKG